MLLESAFLISKLAKRTLNGHPMAGPNDLFLIFLYKSTSREICRFLVAIKEKKKDFFHVMDPKR